MNNNIEIKGNKVVKTFGSRMSYVRESSIYEKVKGLGLAPELTGNWDGAIEHEYIEGTDFGEIIKASMSNPYDFVKYIKLFFDWYIIFRDKVKQSLGDMDFSDFILTDNDKLYCIDFEHCKPASVEHDIASLASTISLTDGCYSRLGLEDAKIFVKNAFDNIEMSSERLYEEIKKELVIKCDEFGIKPMESADEYLASFVCCSFVKSPKFGKEIIQMGDALSRSKHKWTIFADDANIESEKEIRVLLSAEKDDAEILFLSKDGQMIRYPLLVKTEGLGIQFEMAKNSGMKMSELLSKFRYKVVAFEDAN